MPTLLFVSKELSVFLDITLINFELFGYLEIISIEYFDTSSITQVHFHFKIAFVLPLSNNKNCPLNFSVCIFTIMFCCKLTSNGESALLA